MTGIPETITQDEAEDLLYEPTTIRQFQSSHRWYNRELIVFKNANGDLHGFYYDDPATEMQEDQDRFTDLIGDQVRLYNIIPIETVTTTYIVAK
jgi:hypothetical protein